MSKQRQKPMEDNRDVFEKVFDDREFALTPNQSVYALVAGIGAGMLGGRAIAKRLAKKSTRAAEDAALARASKDGSLGWGRGADRKLIRQRGSRVLRGEALGGLAGASTAVYAGTRKKDRNRK